MGIIYVCLGFWMWLSLGETAEQGEAIAFVTVFSLMALVACWLYWALMESSDTQATLGKMALGIVVTDLEGKRVSFGRATRRHFGKIASMLILFIGFIMAGCTAKKQALHDMMAECLVVKRP